MGDKGYIEITTLADVLGLPDDSDEATVLDRIHELRAETGDDAKDDNGEATQLRLGQHPRVLVGADRTATVTLIRPVPSGTVELKDITLREPELRDIDRLTPRQKGKPAPSGQTTALIASLSGWAPRDVGKLCSRDIKTISAVIAFLS